VNKDLYITRTQSSIKHESKARAVAKWPDRVTLLIVNKLGYEARLEVALETV